jgi:hypothetical protein
MLRSNPHLIRAHHRPNDALPAAAAEDDAVEWPLGSLHGTALHYAVKSGSLAMVRLLLDCGADVNAATEPAGWTPLHDATYYTLERDLRDGESIIRTLVQAGADLNATTCGGYRPLDLADFLSFHDRAAEIFDLLLALQQGA